MVVYSRGLFVILFLLLTTGCIQDENPLSIDNADMADYPEPTVTAEVSCTHMRWEGFDIACDGDLDNEIISGYIIFWLSDLDAKMCAYHTTFNTGISLLDENFGQQVEDDWGCVTLSDYSEILPWSRTTAGVWVAWEGRRMELYAPETGEHDFDGLVLYWDDFHISD